MKRLGVGCLVFLICLFELRAQTIQGASQVSVPSPTPYAIVNQDANSRVWQSESYAAGQNGEIVTNIQSYKEIATGLNFLSNGVWAASAEQISLLPNGTGAATNGQHQAYFPGDLSGGQIEMITPDGEQIFSQPLELSYFDGTNTVVLAELTNSIGVIVGNNEVVYPNAFCGMKADIKYSYTRSGLEQDVILHQQPLTPEYYGLFPATARLQMITEFFNSPNSPVLNTELPEQGGLALIDQSIGFGQMQMIQGRAFLLGQSATDPGAFVAKSWLSVDGRQFLVEEVPVNAIVEGLSALPLTAMNEGSGKSRHLASRRLVLPKHRFQAKSASKMRISKERMSGNGFVLDYQSVNSSITNTVYQSDTTYYISGPVYSYGSNVFEGGTVIKYTNNGSIYINPGLGTPGIAFKSSSYLPVIFTSKDDNSVGDAISGSTGNPSSGYYGTMLDVAGFPPAAALANFRMLYALNGIMFSGLNANVYNAQFVDCFNALNISAASVGLRNTLFANNATNLLLGAGTTVNVQNATINGASYVAVGPSTSGSVILSLTNCIFSNYSNLTNGYLTLSGSYNGFYNCSTFGNNVFNTSANPFQTVGAGDYYLANGCSFLNCGTTNIDLSLLGYLSTKTTYPPLLLTNATLSVSTTLVPQAQRDNYGLPSLGWHYDPIGYIADEYWVTNCTLTLSEGVAVACYNEFGLVISDGGSINSSGSAVNPNILTSYQTVQEQPVIMGIYGNGPSGCTDVYADYAITAPNAQFNFTKFKCLAGGGYHIYSNGSLDSFSNLGVQNSEFWGGNNNLSGFYPSVMQFNNNLFSRSTVSSVVTSTNSVSYTNNLFWGVSSVAIREFPSAIVFAYNNDFDSSTLTTSSTCTNGYNAYLNCTGHLNPTNSTDIFSTNGLAYQTSWFGSFYQPTNSVLIQMGNTTANQVGLYHFTTQTNQIPETNAVVDIGYHYVATDQYGNPLDTNGDGLPDYVEDANGNGLVDSGEIGWNLMNDLGLQVIISQPVNGSGIP